MSSNPELKPCPFCCGEPECVVESVRSGYGEYESTENYHVVTCKNCHGTGPRYHQKHLIDFTNYKVSDFRNNPILRANKSPRSLFCLQIQYVEQGRSGKKYLIEAKMKKAPGKTAGAFCFDVR